MITLTRTQEGLLRHMAGQSAPNSAWGKPTVQTYKKLCALGLLEQSDTFPHHRATSDGHDWLVAKDGVVDRMLQTMTTDQIREALRDLTGMEPGRFGWNIGRAAAVIRELDRRHAAAVATTPVGGRLLGEYRPMSYAADHDHTITTGLVGYVVRHTIRDGEIIRSTRGVGYDVAVVVGASRYADTFPIRDAHRQGRDYAVVDNLYGCGCRSAA